MVAIARICTHCIAKTCIEYADLNHPCGISRARWARTRMHLAAGRALFAAPPDARWPSGRPGPTMRARRGDGQG